MANTIKSLLGFAIITFSVAAQAGGFLEKIGLKKSAFQTEYKKVEIPTSGSIGSWEGAPQGHGTVAMVQGRLAVVWAPDSGQRGGGFSFFDLDFSNANRPKVSLMHKEKNEAIREGHGFGFHMQDKNLYAALQTIRGLQIWDWSDLKNPRLVKDLTLPGIEESDYNSGAWWIFWQAPYIYVGGSGNGLYVIDAKDVENPQLIQRRGPENFKLNRTGPVFAVGNILVTSMTDGSGLSTIDISDPGRPRLLDSLSDIKIYSIFFNGNKVYVAGADKFLHIVSVSPNGKLTFESKISIGDKGGYVTYQDGYAFVGASKQFVKVDVRDSKKPKVVAWGSSKAITRDEDFANALGPYVLIGDDHGNGSYWARHANEDKNPPVVTMVSPSSQAQSQAVTSRIGLSFSDQIDLATVNAKTFIVQPVGGSPLKGFYSSQSNIINFSPESPLSPHEKYEIIIPAGGIKDYWGNPTPGFKSTFTTGSFEKMEDLKILAKKTGLSSEEIVFSVSGGEPQAQYFWDFGDGRGFQGPMSGTEARARFSKPGHYSVSVRSEGKNIVTSNAFRVSIHHPLTGQRATRSSSIAMDAKNERVFNVNPEQGTVTAISSKNLSVLWESYSGQDPKTLAVDNQERVWVANSQEDCVSVMDGATGHIIKKLQLPFGSRPYGIASSADGAEIFVTLASRGELVTIQSSNFSFGAVIRLGPSPRGIAVTGDGQFALVSRFISANNQGAVYKVNLKTKEVKVIGLSIDKTPDTESSGRGLPNYLGFLAISPDGRKVAVPSKKDNILRGPTKDGLPLTFESSVRAMLAQIDLTGNSEILSLRTDFNDRDLPVAAEFSPEGGFLFIAAQGSNSVEIVDTFSGQVIKGLENVGLAPQGLVLTPAGNKLFVHSFLSRQVIVFDVSNLDRPSRIAEIKVVRMETLTEEVLLGKQIFYNSKDRRMSRDGYISCASCHQDGGEDGRVWDFTDRGEGLRNTTSLKGRAGMKQGRVHWTGNFDEIQDFENDIRNNFGGKGFLTDEQFLKTQDTLGLAKAGLSKELDALAAYVGSLDSSEKSPYRNSQGGLTEEALKGQKIFQDLRCATCHAGSDFTDSPSGVLHDVGTATDLSGKRRGQALNGFDTPTLKGVWATPPYLHDGSAASLKDVLVRRNQQGLHGETHKLQPQELDQLIMYLLSL